MDLKIKYVSKDKKKKKERHFEFKYSNEVSKFEIFLTFILSLLCNGIFLEFVVKIVKLMQNRPFYYLFNNRFFIYYGVDYEFKWTNWTKNKWL